jgi:hypothetical protein
MNNNSQKYWPTPSQKSWLAFYCDGKCFGIIQESAAAEREKKRFLGLKGMEVRFALPDDLIRFRACTKLSSRILRVMSEKSICCNWKSKFAKEYLKRI